MMAISLWQPWASLIACGVKPFETRDWAPPAELIGQTIAIHAAKKVDRDAARFAEDIMFGQHRPGGADLAEKIKRTFSRAGNYRLTRFGHTDLPIGCIVCTVRLAAAYRLGAEEMPAGILSARVAECRPTVGLATAVASIPVDSFGDYSPGRWAWRLADPQPINPPAPVTGQRGFFHLPQGWLTGGEAR